MQNGGSDRESGRDSSRDSSNELFPTEGWRLLLPDPAPSRVIALGDGPTATTARRLWPRTEARQADDRPADLVVTDSSDATTLAEVAELLGPNTMAYLQFDWPRHRSYDRLHDRLRRAGLPTASLYSISPAGHRWAATWWIPVNSHGAARFVAGQLTPVPSRSANLVDRVRGHLLTHWQRNPDLVARHPWLLHPGRRQRVGVVIAGSGIGENAQRETETIMKIGGSSTDQPILFTFGPRRGAAPVRSAGPPEEPDVVIKVPTQSEEIEASRREAEVLTMLGAIDPPVSRIPRPVDARRYRSVGLRAFGQTYAPGRPMALVVTPNSLAEHAAAVGDWLVELAARTTQPTDTERVTASLDRRLAELQGSLGALPDGAELGRALAAAVRGIDRSVSVHRHHDLGPWNVHVTDAGEITVIDWADAAADGVPACDFIHFLPHLGLCAHDAYRPDRRDRLIAEIVDPSTALGRLVWRMTADHVVRVGLAPEQIPHLRVLTWALDLLRRPPEQRTSGLYLELIRAEIRRGTRVQR